MDLWFDPVNDISYMLFCLVVLKLQKGCSEADPALTQCLMFPYVSVSPNTAEGFWGSGQQISDLVL